MESKNGSMVGGWSTLSIPGSYGVSLWKYINKGWDCFREHIRFVVSCGLRVRFWYDCWCENTPLRLVFLLLFSLAQEGCFGGGLFGGRILYFSLECLVYKIHE